MNSSASFFECEKIGPEILHNFENRTDDGVVSNAKTRKVKNLEFLYIQKTYIDSYIWLD